MNERALGGSGLVASIFSKQRDEDGYVKAVPCPTGAQCVFFHPPDNTCRVYADRPFECRFYPFLLVNTGQEASVSVHLHCPYIQAQRHTVAFSKHVKRLQSYFQKEDVLAWLRNNRLLFGDYSEYHQEIQRLFSLAL